MRTLLITLGLFGITFISSCKKCYTCSNVCYDCHQGAGSIICSTDASSWGQFNAVIDQINSTSTVKCTKIEPTLTKDFCETSSSKANDLKATYESVRYKCTAK